MFAVHKSFYFSVFLILFLFQIKIGRLAKNQTSKIDVNQVKDHFSENPYFGSASALEIAIKMENVKTLQSIFSRHLPPERYHGIVNLLYINLYENSTTEEIESALVMRLIQLNSIFGIEMEFGKNE